MFSPIKKQQTGYNEKRTERRYAIDLPAHVQMTDGTSVAVQVSDISSTGALVAGNNLGAADDVLILTLTDFGTIEARIAHCGSDFVGIEFTNPGQIRDRLINWLAEEI